MTVMRNIVVINIVIFMFIMSIMMVSVMERGFYSNIVVPSSMTFMIYVVSYWIA